MCSAFVMQNGQGFMNLSYVYSNCDLLIQVVSMRCVGIVYHFVSWGRARAGKRHLSFCKRWRFVAQSQIWLLFLLLEIFGVFSLRGVQWICVTMHHSPLIPRLKPEFRWRLRVEDPRSPTLQQWLPVRRPQLGSKQQHYDHEVRGPKLWKQQIDVTHAEPGQWMAENPGIALCVEGYQGGTGFDGVFFILKITDDSKDVQSWGNGMMVCVLKYLGRTMQQFVYSFEGKNTFVFLDVWYDSFGCFMFVFLHQCSCSWLTGPSRSIVYVYIFCWSLIVTRSFSRRSRGKRCIMSYTSCPIGSSQSNLIVVEYFLCVSNYTWTYWL